MADYWYNTLHGNEPREQPADRADTPSRHAPPADPSHEALTSESLAKLLRRLVVSHDSLLQRFEQQITFLEAERREREHLSAQIAHLTAALEDVRSATPAAQPIAQMVRDGVADEIRPLLVAVVELLELGVELGRTPEPAPNRANNELPPMHGLELPTILTRPLEDLLEPRRRTEPRSAAVGPERARDKKHPSSRGLFGRRRPVQQDVDGDHASRRTGKSPWTPVKS